MAGQRTWAPTAAHLRAVVAAATSAVGSVLLHRPDLLLLGLPFAVITVWSLVTRPSASPEMRTLMPLTTVREGEATTWRTEVTHVAGMEEVTTLLEPPPWSQLAPAGGVQSLVIEHPFDETPRVHRVETGWRSLRWGRRGVGPGLVSATSAWSSFRWGPHEAEPIHTTTLPLPAVFDASAPAPHPFGLVGVNRSARPGDGSEFASIRPFQVGDRLRRIHWPVSTRTGELHVTSSHADQDTHVVLVLDAFNDLGESEGVDGAASTLDVSVRAAGAVAEHYLHRGERVSLRVLGSAHVTQVPPASGKNHLRRVLGTLASVRAGTDHDPDERLAHLGIGAGALVVMLSPLVAGPPLQHAVTLARRGLAVVVIDTLPPDLSRPDDDAHAEVAWRVRMLERDREVRAIRQAGVPVVPWQGPGSLDQVLRELGQQASGPRMAHR